MKWCCDASKKKEENVLHCLSLDACAGTLPGCLCRDSPRICLGRVTDSRILESVLGLAYVF